MRILIVLAAVAPLIFLVAPSLADDGTPLERQPAAPQQTAATTGVPDSPAVAADAGAAIAAGDPAKGEKEFRRCAACHALEPGKKMVGPSLHGIFGARAAHMEGFSYSDAVEEASEKGLTWTAENLFPYLADPKAFLADYLDKDRVSNKMLMKFPQEDLRRDVIAYLAQLSQEGD